MDTCPEVKLCYNGIKCRTTRVGLFETCSTRKVMCPVVWLVGQSANQSVGQVVG